MSMKLTLPVLLLLGVFALLPSNALAAVIKQTGDPTNVSSMNSYMQSQTTVLSDGLVHTFGSMTVYAAQRTLSGSPVYLRIKNLTSNSFIDCRTDYINASALPTVPDTTGGPAAQGDGTILNLDFSGTQCTSVPGAFYFVYQVTDANPTNTGARDLWFGGNSSNGEGSIIVRDGPFVNPPTTDFNEVVDYIYDPILDNSVGTSTVGARFSIPEPDWVSSIGFDLRGPLGTILYTGSTTPTVAGTYDVDTDYYFGTAGAYELVAWFVSDTGQKIINPVSVFIVIDAEPWVFDPVTGDLVPVSSTTIATSTLTNFKVECPDDVLVGSLCKLAVGLFIPNASSIQGLQASFYGLMGKAPFSFFTQSKTVLDAFRVGSAATGGTLSLTLYGSEVDILSATTSASVGVDSDVINLLKGVMIVGLWLMLAWYLYWRIASIFGV